MAVDIPVIMMQMSTPAFTSLPDIYMDSNSLSVSNMIGELNTFCEPIIQFLMSQGADFVHTTDSMSSWIWDVKDVNRMTSCYHAVVCALHVQQQFKNFKTTFGVVHRTSIGLSLGTIKLSFVGIPSEQTLFYMGGEVINQCYSALNLCKFGKVVLSTVMLDSLKECVSSFDIIPVAEGFIQISIDGEKPRVRSSITLTDEDSEMEEVNKNHMPVVLSFLEPISTSTLQQFNILPCLYQISSCFIYIENLKPSDLDVIQSATLLLLRHLKFYEGRLSTIIYHLGVTFCVIFGYPGYQHHKNTAKCVLFSCDIYEAMCELQLQPLIRMSTGLCLHGLTGNQYRLQVSLIGQPIRFGMQMKDKFKNIPIFCCINTYLRARREVGEIFRKLDRAEGNWRNFTIAYIVDFRKKKEPSKLKSVGRRHDQQEVLSALQELRSPQIENNFLPLIVIVGEIGVGKTHFLKWIYNNAEEVGFKCSCIVTDVSFEEEYERIWIIVSHLLVSSCKDSESAIVEILGQNADKFPLHLLNQHVNTKFPVQKTTDNELLADMLIALIKGCANGEPVLIALDNGEVVGRSTWRVLQELLVSRTAFVIVCLRDADAQFNILPFVTYMFKGRYKTIHLKPLDDEYIGGLICCFLNIGGMHKSIVKLVTEHCKGNPLLMQEILLLPQLQHHYCFVQSRSIGEHTYRTQFVTAPACDLICKCPDQKVCDVLNEENLQFMVIPQSLLVLVREHTEGLSAEEQLLVKKCACLGNEFGFTFLEVVCPEYDKQNLNKLVLQLVRKSVLTQGCNHLNPLTLKIDNSFILSGQQSFCQHPLKFTSVVLQNCIKNSINDSKKQSLHLFIVSRLKKAVILCDSCSASPKIQVLVAYSFFTSDYLIPRLNFFYCQCHKFLVKMFETILYHMKKGQATSSVCIKMLLLAAETTLMYEEELMVEKFLNEAQILLDKGSFDEEETASTFSVPLARASLKRLQCQLALLIGNIREAKEKIDEALIFLGKAFTHGIQLAPEKRRMSKKQEMKYKKEEALCLIVGCNLFLSQGFYAKAYSTAKTLEKDFKKLLKNKESNFPNFCHMLKLQCMYLTATSKVSSTKRMNKLIKKVLNMCDLQLQNTQENGVFYMRAIIFAYYDVANCLFEKNILTNAIVIASQAFQIAKIVNGQRELTKIVPLLCLSFYYSDNTRKCLELLGILQEVYEKTGDILAVAMENCLLVLELWKINDSEMYADKKQMCDNFVSSESLVILPTKNINQIYWMTSLLALWSFTRNLVQPFEKWHARALQCKDECVLSNYWAISASLTMLIIGINQLSEKRFIKHSIYVETELISEEIGIIEKQADCYAPVLKPAIESTKALIQQAWLGNMPI